MTISLGTATSTSVATAAGATTAGATSTGATSAGTTSAGATSTGTTVATSTSAASKLSDLCLIYLFNKRFASVPIISFTSNNFREVYFPATSAIRQ
jgi:hypothetical protein